MAAELSGFERFLTRLIAHFCSLLLEHLPSKWDNCAMKHTQMSLPEVDDELVLLGHLAPMKAQHPQKGCIISWVRDPEIEGYHFMKPIFCSDYVEALEKALISSDFNSADNCPVCSLQERFNLSERVHHGCRSVTRQED